MVKFYKRNVEKVCGCMFRGHPFGFGKSDGKQIKNKIPKGLRLLPNSHVNID